MHTPSLSCSLTVDHCSLRDSKVDRADGEAEVTVYIGILSAAESFTTEMCREY